MSIGTLKQEILADTHSLVDSDTVYRKILAAMRHHREKRLWFSERTFRFTLTQGKDKYSLGDGPPADLQEIVGRELWLLIDGDEDQREPIYRVPTRSLESAKTEGTNQDEPEYWDFFGNQLRFYPTPDSSSHVVEGRYVRDIGIPIVRYENSAFAYYAPGGAQKLSSAELDGFENDWTDPAGAASMIRTRAMYLLYKEYLRDAEQADAFLAQWLEQVGLLEGETEAKTAGATEVVPWLMD